MTLIFDKYEIQYRLAVGGMGEVFFARQKGVKGFDRNVILKGLLPDLAQDSNFVEQFLDEARVAANLSHPNVVGIFEVGLWNGTYFIAMEYIRGRHLGQLQRRVREAGERLPFALSARIIADAAAGLHHAHFAVDANGKRLSIVHRDISPQNIMVREDGVTKVVDFGIARAANRMLRTATGVVKGKLAYMAPEQATGQDLDARVDQFALGVCLWEMLTAQRLFKGDGDLMVLKKLINEPIEPPSSVHEDVPPELDAVVMRMLERSRERRFDTCAEVSEALGAIAIAHGMAGSDAVGEWLTRLGTDDVTPRPLQTPTGPNFVQQLGKPNASHQTRVMPGREVGTNRGLVIAGVVAALVALGLGGAVASRVVSAQRPETPTVPATAVAVEPVPLPDVDAGPSEAEPAAVPEAAQLFVTSNPSGATVRFDGRKVGVTPLTLDANRGTTHFVRLELPGHVAHEQDVALTDARTPLAVTLVALASKAPEPAKEGYLSVGISPWAKVIIDGVDVGITPVIKRRLSVGTHTLRVVNEEAGIDSTRQVAIRSGETTKVTTPR